MPDTNPRLLRSSDYRRMPWKNGGGETVEIAVFPEAAGLADFDWRVSMATVASDGPFSVFPGIDRTLSILDGQGMTLFIDGQDPVLLTVQSDPLPFAADAPTTATLSNGPITDLNVMTRRGTLSHTVRRMLLDGETRLTLDAGTTLIFCGEGTLDVRHGDDGMKLKRHDCLVFDLASSGDISLSGVATALVIRLRKA